MELASSSLISVIIPAYNAERFLARTLHSALRQTHKELDIVIVDDGSKDRTAEIAEQFASAEPRIRVIRSHNQGVSAARNQGIAHAKGDYVAFLDADDLWHPEKLASQRRLFDQASPQNGLGGVYTLFRYIDEQDNVIADNPFWEVRGRVLARHLVYNFIGIGGSSLLCRKDAALSVGGFDITYQDADARVSEDYDFQLKIATDYTIDVVPRYLVGYRRHPGTRSTDRSRNWRAHRAIITYHLDRNPTLSPKCQSMALGASCAMETRAYLQAMHFGKALRAAFRLLKTDPPRFAAEVFQRVPRSAILSLWSRLSTTRRGLPLRKFDDLAPGEASPKRHAPLTARRLELLAREDDRVAAIPARRP